MYRKLYVDGCVDIVCNAVKVQSPLTLEQLCQIIQENLPGSCVPKDNLKEDARLVILDDSSFTIKKRSFYYYEINEKESYHSRCNRCIV